MPARRFLACWVLALTPWPVAAAAQPAPASPPLSTPASPAPATRESDLDQLMARVLANRDQSWRTLREYLLDERESFRLVGPDGSPMFGLRKDFVWVARNGRAVRSPVRVNGVAVGEQTRPEEARWQADLFLRFKFEPGNYYFVARESLSGRDVIRIEYYPRRLFSEESEPGTRKESKRDAADDTERRLERAINKVSLVTLWVDPAVHQIVRYTFDNVDFNFLPGRSLVRVDTATATMTMGQPFAGIWLPESLVVEGAITLATGTYRAEYTRRFSDYRQADVQMRFRVKDDEK